LAELRRGGRIVGLAEVALASPTGPSTSADLRFPPDRSRLTFLVQRVDTVAAFGPDTWRRP
jgi:hypothetical protein